MFSYGERSRQRRIDGRTARGVACGRRNDAAASPCVVLGGRTDRQRAGADPRTKPAARLATFETFVRSRASRSVSRRQLGLLSPQFGERGKRPLAPSRRPLRQGG